MARSDRDAERLHRLAADQGCPAGQASFATLHVSGRDGLRRDDQEAVRLWRLAADGGVEEARGNLRKAGRS